MCGRYQISDDKDIEEINKILTEINNRYHGTGTKAKTGEVFPSDIVPILSIEEKKPSITLMKWGFPKWDKGLIINAVSETAHEKKSFSASLREKRCVILSTGFYEWHKEKKDKYLFNTPGSKMLYMAGVYNNFNNVENNFVILTKKANNCISDIHSRMPVILQKNELISWLKGIEIQNFFERNNEKLIREKV